MYDLQKNSLDLRSQQGLGYCKPPPASPSTSYSRKLKGNAFLKEVVKFAKFLGAQRCAQFIVLLDII